MAKMEGISDLFIHAFTDGRDTSPTSGAVYVETIERALEETGVGKISTLMGRYWAMDRDRRWERTRRGFDAVVHGVGERTSDPLGVVEARYAAGETDEFLEPIVVDGTPRIAPGGVPIQWRHGR